MADFTIIWSYVERELKVQIPPYIKNVLLCCGFDNCYTIATIEENDLEYFQDEVRKCNLFTFFKDKTSEGFQLEKVLEGCTKSEKDFEFCRGHRKLIISIAKLVKENLDKNAIDGFASIKPFTEKPKAKSETSGDAINISGIPFKREKNSPQKLVIESRASEDNVEPILYPEHDEIIGNHRSKLIKQALTSLKSDTPKLFQEKFKLIQAAVRSNLVTVTKKKNEPGYTAVIKCPYCKANTKVFHYLNGKNERGTWNSSNFGRHLEKLHLRIPKTKTANKKTRDADDDFILDIIDSASEDNVAIKTDDNICTKPDENVVTPAVVAVNNHKYCEANSNEDYILIEVPSKVDPVIIMSAIDEGKGVGINSETFIVTSSQPLESLEEISVRYPDSLHQSELEESSSQNFAKAEIDSFGAANTEACNKVVPIIRNGNSSTKLVPKIYTVNTCAFDSDFFVYACCYFDNQSYREALEFFIASVEKMRDWYDCRDLILNEIFSSNYYKKCDNMMNNRSYIYINCITGIGGLFGQICAQSAENITSAIELKICSVCEITTGKLLPFLTIDNNNCDLRSIQKSIGPSISKDRLCTTCKSQCDVHKILNEIIVLEVEPIAEIQFQETIPIQNITDIITIANQYELLAVVEFNPTISHFLTHLKRKNNVWKTYDDLRSSEYDTDITKEIHPYLLFYKQKTYHLADYSDFKTTLLSFFHKNKLRKPMLRKILPSERCKVTSRTTQNSKHSAQANSAATTTSAERNKKLEMGWKY